jgi:hypothetical protein
MKTKTNIMKTTFLFPACLLIAAVSFGQTVVKNEQQTKSLTTAQAGKSGPQLNSSTSTSSSASIQSNAVNETEKTAHSDAEKGKQYISAEKKAATEEAKTEEKEVKNTASKNQSLSVGEQSDATLNTGNKDNKISENSSLNNQAKLSGPGVETTDKQLEKKGKTTAESASAIAAQGSNAVKTKTDKTEEKMEKRVKTTVKPKPASIKMDALVKANTAIRIK